MIKEINLKTREKTYSKPDEPRYPVSTTPAACLSRFK